MLSEGGVFTSTEIYYFSGTGNSLVVARDIAARVEGTLVPIASTLDWATVSPHADRIGIVFPVYYGELPVIVKEFAAKLENLQGKYVFAVCTYGGAAMASLRVLARIIRSKGGRLSAGFGVHMPQNSFYKPRENHQEIYSECKTRLEVIVNKVESRTTGVFYTNPLLEVLLIPIQSVFIQPICRKSFAKQTNMPEDSRIEDLVRMMDTGFVSNENCSGCGVCARVCPVGNIEIVDGKPVWQHRCETCLACYNWCPNKAIQGGITKGYYYLHPEVTAAEMMRQRN